MFAFLTLALVALQAAPPDSLVVIIVKAAAALLLPPVATWLAMQFSKVVARVDKMPDWEKRLLVAVYAVVISGISHAIGLVLPEAWGALSSVDIQAALNVGLTYVLHRLVKPKEVPTPLPVTVVG